ncbi:hypothetical protein B296_00054154 [Ensete ventricosum]|uniref:Uncharacterized protein n=1 Tax=Ensete ventricosum TaxID=4639 RepID=A0A426XR27_ENSVE|nr:hypothetical protein B296_00054154 [Ensete ventricosum]
MHRVDTVGNSPGVRWELADGIESLPGWRKGVRQKKTETHRKIVEGSRKACRERFAEWIGKLAGRSPEEDRKTRHKNVGGCRIGGTGGCTATALVFGRLTRPGWAVEPPVPKCSGD